MQAWRDSKTEQPRPHHVRQLLAPNATYPSLVQAALNAEGHTTFQYSDELAAWLPSDKAQRKYFMSFFRQGANREMTGDERVGKDSVSGICRPCPAGVFAGTWNQFEEILTTGSTQDGMATRMALCPLRDTAFNQRPTITDRSQEQKNHIREAALWLRTQSGEVLMPQSRIEIRAWDEEKRQQAMNEGNNAKDLYRRRAADLALKYTSVYHLLKSQTTGNQEESPETPRLARILAEYILQNQLLIFGQYHPETLESRTGGQSKYGSVLDELPETFTREDIIRLRPNLSSNARRQMVRHWVKQGLITKPNPDELRWVKVTT